MDVKRMWELLRESNAETMQLKLYKNEGDAKPFRCIVFVEGEQAVEDVGNFLNSYGGETYVSPRLKT